MEIRTYQLSKIEHAGLTLAGYSVAGEETVLIMPELDSVFDIGKCPREALSVNHVLLSHSHMDHCAGLPYYFAQRDFQGIANGKALVPAATVGLWRKLLSAWGRVEGHVPPHEFIGMEPGDDYQIRRGLLARAFNVRHGPASLGYSLIDVRNKLKAEFLGLDGPEIVDLKKRGVDITDSVEVPLAAYLGDTAKANYSDLPCVRNAKMLLLECTFFEPDHISRARAGNHIHLVDLPDVLEGMNNERIVLVHLTRRTNMGLARKVLRKALPKDVLERITFLMSRKYIEQ